MCLGPPVSRLRLLLSGILLLACCATEAARAAEEKVSIQLRGQPGQAWVFEQTYDVSISSMLSADGQEPQAVTQTMHQIRSGTIRLLQAKDGTATAMKISFDAACNSTVEQTGQERQEVEFPLAGQTVAIWRGADGSVEHSFQGPLAEQTLNELRAMIEPESRLYPPMPVSRGDTWKISKDALARNFQLKEGDLGAGLCRLDAVKTVEARPVIDLAIGVSLIKFEQGFIKTEINLKGGARVDLGTGHTIAGVLEGPLMLSGSQQVMRGGRKVLVKVSGEGKVAFRSVSKWVVVAPPPRVEAPPVAMAEPQKLVVLPTTRPSAMPVVTEPPRVLPPGVLAAGGVGVRPPNSKPVTPRNGGAPLDDPVLASAGPTHAPVAEEPFSGNYRDENLRIEVQTISGNSTGTIRLGAQRFPLNGKVEAQELKGTFQANGVAFPFTATLEGPLLVLTTESTIYRLKREPTHPLDK